jgi:hypothetical protein
MLRAVSLVAQWEHIQAGLPGTWGNVRLALRVDGGSDTTRAAALLGPLQPGRSGRELRFQAARAGDGPSPAAVGRALARLDAERIQGELELLGTGEAAAEARPVPRQSLVAAWDEALATLPRDWSDVYAEVELTSTDHLEPAALALAPVNPARYGGPTTLRFRCARHFGYGASAGMVRRCLARLDERGVPGRLRILRALSDTKPVATQGPVWYFGGKVV